MKKRSITSSLCLSLLMSGCTTLNEVSRADLSCAAAGAAGIVTGLITAEGKSDRAKVAAALAGGLAGCFIGKEFAKRLDERDRQKLYAAQQNAAATGRPVTFKGENEGVSGRVSIVSSEPVEKKRKPVKVKYLRGKVETIPPLDLVGARYLATNATNIRGGPSTDYVKVGRLKGGQAVQVIGQVTGENWYLVSQLIDGVASGYVYKPLLKPTNKDVTYLSSSVEVNNKSVQVTQVCRTVKQELTTKEGTFSENMRVCQQGDGTWKLA